MHEKGASWRGSDSGAGSSKSSIDERIEDKLQRAAARKAEQSSLSKAVTHLKQQHGQIAKKVPLKEVFDEDFERVRQSDKDRHEHPEDYED